MRRPLDVTVGIPTCDDDPRVLALALDAIAAQPIGAATLVVDMSGGTHIAQVARGRPDRVRYVGFPESSGVAESRNRILELADTRYVLFLDADAVPLPGWATAMADALAAADDVALVGARILPLWPGPPPPLFTTTLGLELLGMLDLGRQALDVPRVMGTSFAVDRQRLPRPAPFRSELGRRPGRLIAWEEVALSLDITATGGRIRYEPRATVRHHVRDERLSWRWMARRAYTAGRETRLAPGPLEPFPRSLTMRDRAFWLVTTPASAAGRLRGPGP